MASPQTFPLGIYSELQTYLKSSLLLPYVEEVFIRKYRYNDLPSFSHHAIVLSPMSAEAMQTGVVNTRWIENEIMIVMLVKPVYGGEQAIIGNDTKTGDPPAYGFNPPKIGILRMYEDVFKSLYGSTLNGAIQIVPGMGELDSRGDFNVLMDDDREGFLMEAKLLYRPRGYPFYGLP